MTFNDVQKYATDIENTILRGVNGIISTEVIPKNISKLMPDGSIETEETYIITTYGTNLIEILQLDEVDSSMTISNSIREMEMVYGIECARNSIINRMRASLGAEKTLYCHCAIYADEMTSTFEVTNIELQGMSLRDTGNNLLKMGMKRPAKIIEEVTPYGGRNRVDGIHAALMMGQTPKYGSTYNSVAINTKAIAEFKREANSKDITDDL
jgi:DNA-directed RNA polymerase beta' subunit